MAITTTQVAIVQNAGQSIACTRQLSPVRR